MRTTTDCELLLRVRCSTILMTSQWHKWANFILWYYVFLIWSLNVVEDKQKQRSDDLRWSRLDYLCFFSPIQGKGAFVSTIILCHLQPPALSTPVMVTNWPISHSTPCSVQLSTLFISASQRGEGETAGFSVTPASTGLVTDHPQLAPRHPPVHRACVSLNIVKLLEWNYGLKNIYKGICNGTPNPSPPTLSACV